MLTKNIFIEKTRKVFEDCPGNRVDIPGSGPTLLFDSPLIGFASAEDDLFRKYKDEKIIGPMFMSPREWLPEAQTVVSFFLPFSEEVRTSNRENLLWPSLPWLYGRIEGQDFIRVFANGLQQTMKDEGLQSCVPWIDSRFKRQLLEYTGGDGDNFHVNSAWSERHVAYICGLGTFGLSRGLITEAGMAGRFTSIILDAKYEPDRRPYSATYEYCIHCGACVRRCPAGAITMEYGKNNVKCKQFLDMVKEKENPRYGCGKCQAGVPCEFRRPEKRGFR